MTDFKREERYIVVKIKDIGATRLGALRQFLAAKEIPTRECVVVEPDWAIYDETWENVQRLAEGRPSIGQERDALAAHVERLEDIIERSTLADSPAAESALEDTPETSLARLKAEWQADRAEQIREMCEGLTGSQIRSALDGLLAGLRHRAKEEK